MSEILLECGPELREINFAKRCVEAKFGSRTGGGVILRENYSKNTEKIT